MKYTKFILVNETKDQIFESSVLNWVSHGEDSTIEKTHNDIDIGLNLIFSSPSEGKIIYESPSVKMIMGDTETDYFRIIRFRADNWDIYRLLCQKNA